MINEQQLRAKCLTTSETFNSKILDGEIVLRELTMAENDQVTRIQHDKEKTLIDVKIYIVKCAMLEPAFLADEDLKNLGKKGMNFIEEVVSFLPYIGMNEKEKQTHDENMKKYQEEMKNNKKTKEELEKESEKK